MLARPHLATQDGDRTLLFVHGDGPVMLLAQHPSMHVMRVVT